MADLIEFQSAEIQRVMNELDDPTKFLSLMRPHIDAALSVIEGEIKERAPYGVDGQLRSSITHSVFLRPTESLGQVFIQPDSAAALYAEFVEMGRNPGKMPPVEKILPWVTKKHTAAVAGKTGKAPRKSKQRDKDTLSIAWAVAVTIKKKGTPGQHFFDRGFKAAEADANRILELGVSQALDAL